MVSAVTFPRTDFIRALGELIEPQHRGAAIRRLSELLGVETFVLFVHDAEIDKLLAAPGFAARAEQSGDFVLVAAVVWFVLGANADNLVLTSGATEAVHLALTGAGAASLIVSAVEHDAVFEHATRELGAKPLALRLGDRARVLAGDLDRLPGTRPPGPAT